MADKQPVLRLPLNLQFFGGNGEPPAGGEPNPEEAGQGGASGAQPSNTNPEGTTPPAEAGEPKDSNPSENLFTQEQVNNFVAREARKAQEKLFKELGIEDFESAKEGLEQFNQWKEAQKTEQQRQEEQLKSTTKRLEEVTQENTSLQAQIFAMKAGVLPDSVSDVVTLAQSQVTDEVTLEQAISQVVEKYPHFKQPEQASPEEEQGNFPQFTNGAHQSQGGQPSELDKWKEAFNK